MGEEEAEEWQAPRPESSSLGAAEAGLAGSSRDRLGADWLGPRPPGRGVGARGTLEGAPGSLGRRSSLRQTAWGPALEKRAEGTTGKTYFPPGSVALGASHAPRIAWAPPPRPPRRSANASCSPHSCPRTRSCLPLGMGPRVSAWGVEEQGLQPPFQQIRPLKQLPLPPPHVTTMKLLVVRCCSSPSLASKPWSGGRQRRRACKACSQYLQTDRLWQGPGGEGQGPRGPGPGQGFLGEHT
ncbi:uncharacterized protein LOC132221206 [Myotis daubentonii]|uniref:uncharacterized protein LOC132221206 n=1 Tax=Myotis daubentonii TaxID=98922 RepID=UPI002873E306|nr:uncharacterized protein LOC132221206 [Myotis daubentonii]